MDFSKKDKRLNILSLQLALLIFLSISLVNGQSTNDTFLNSTANSTQSNVTISPPFWLNYQKAQLDRFMLDRYNYYVTAQGNKVWSCAMDLAWNQMKRSFLMGINATFNNPNDLQQKITDNYNSQHFTRDQLSDDSYYVGSGYGTKGQDKINFQVKQKFSNKKFSSLSYNLKDQDFIIYSYLQKAFQFKTPFSQCPSFKFKGVHVNGFQALTKKQKKQLYYKYYNNENDFLMGIQTANKNDEVLLLKSNLTQFQNIKIDKIEKWIEMYSKLPNKKLKYFDQFKMPDLNFDFTRYFNEMKGLYFTNPQKNQSSIQIMQQRLMFKVNRYGVQLSNDAVIVIVRINFFLDTKYFHLNKGFWLILKQKNKKPYLIINVKSVNETWISL